MIILDLPIEIFHKHIFQYLDDKDIDSFGRANDSKLKKIADNYVLLGKFQTLVFSSNVKLRPVLLVPYSLPMPLIHLKL